MTPGRPPPPGPHNLRLCLLTLEAGCPDRDPVCEEVRAQHQAEFRDLEQRRKVWESLAKWTVDRIARARGL